MLLRRKLTVVLVPLVGLRLVYGIVFGVAVTSSASLLWAQATSSATVTGQATDQQGAAIPSTEVKLLDNATNQGQTTRTNEVGRYVFANVSPGNYTVTFSKEGFQAYRIPSQQVQIGTTVTLNAVLQVGSTATTVEVQAQAAAELQTTNAAVGTTMSSKDIEGLPNLGRDVATLAVLQPGVTMGGYTAGAVQDQNTYTIDGGQNTDDMSGNNTSYTTNFTGLGGTQQAGSSAGVVPTPVESIEEFKVNSFNQTADVNNGLGSQIQMVTKRGQSTFHGAAYGYYFASNIGAANTWVNNHTPSNGPNGTTLPYTPLPSNHRDRFGGALGGPITDKSFLGGKWFFFFNYEGFRFPNSLTYERPVPSDLLKAGVIQIADASGVSRPYNLNPYPVAVNGNTYQPAVCGTGRCDPRNIGINPIVQRIWSTQMPKGNDPTYASGGADGLNVLGYQSTIRTPLNTDTYVGRIDHDFGDKWKFMSSYRSMRLVNLTNNQVDIGGVLPGDVLGHPTAVAPRDQVPSMYVAGLTTILSPSATNTFTWSYTRNFWQWGSVNASPQVAGLGGAVEIAPGASSTSSESTNALIPYNIDTQSVRQRFWDGQDHMIKDDLTMIKGSHIVQFGGLYQRNYDFHMRSDNGNGVNNAIVYQIGSNGLSFSDYNYPTSVPSSQYTNYQNLAAEVFGIVSQPQVNYTRSGANLQLQPIGNVAYERSIISTYNFYLSDSWHVKPTLTLTYGLSYALEMPPYELNGNQVILVDQSGAAVDAESYMAKRKAAALAGQVYNPTLGYETIKNTGRKYPYNPVYDQWSPRAALAWNPKYSSGVLGKIFGDGKTVIRGGYGRIYGRLNGANLVLVPLLGPGLLQAVSCSGPSSNGQCLGSGNVTPASAFRIGTDGNSAPLPAASQTLAQPFFPGINGAYAQDPSTLDPNVRPEKTDNFTFSIQRAIGTHNTLEVGYIGRIIKNEMGELNLDAVPYMTTLNGQTFAQAYANTYFALAASNFAANASVPVQPFFETSLGGANSTYCRGSASCTAKLVSVAASNFKNTQVSNLWKTMNAASSWTLGNTMIDTKQMSSTGLITNNGQGNYNALFVTWRARDYHGASIVSNLTWGRALGTTAVAQATSSFTQLDPFNVDANYGPNSFDIKFIYNLAITYQPPVFKTQKGLAGHLLGGWTFSPLFTAQSGPPRGITYTEGNLCTNGCQAFGESSSSGVSSYGEYAISTGYYYSGGTSAHYNVKGSNGVGTNNATGVNLFGDPANVASLFRPCILGYDTSCGGYGNIRGQGTWNLDGQALKTIGIWKEGRVGATLSFQITNMLNHAQLGDPAGTSRSSTTNLSINNLTNFGKITTQSNTPRNMEFGLRVFF